MRNKLRFISLLLSLTAITLSGCNSGSSAKSTSKEKGLSVSDSTSAEVSSSSSATSVVPGPTSTTGTSSSGSITSSSTSEESSVVYTAETVASDINAIFSPMLEGAELLSYNSTYDYYEGGLYFDEDGADYSNTQPEQDVLQPPVATLAHYMPEYLEVVSTHFYTSEEDWWKDESGDTVFEAVLRPASESVEVVLYSYCYNNHLIGAVAVSNAE